MRWPSRSWSLSPESWLDIHSPDTHSDQWHLWKLSKFQKGSLCKINHSLRSTDLDRCLEGIRLGQMGRWRESKLDQKKGIPRENMKERQTEERTVRKSERMLVQWVHLKEDMLERLELELESQSGRE